MALIHDRNVLENLSNDFLMDWSLNSLRLMDKNCKNAITHHLYRPQSQYLPVDLLVTGQIMDNVLANCDLNHHVAIYR